MPDPIMAEAPIRTPTKQAEPHVIERVVERALDPKPAPTGSPYVKPEPEPAPEEPVIEHVPVFFQSIWTSVVRTFVPQIVALIVAVLAKAGLQVEDDVIVLAVSEAFAVAYYVIIRGLEEFKSSKWGRGLGKATRPLYFKES